MKVSKIPGLGRFGVFVDDVDFANITDDEWMEIGKLHLESLVTIIRDTKLDQFTYLEMMSKWGSSRNSNLHTLSKKYKLPYSAVYQLAMANDPIINEADRKFLHQTMNMVVRTNDNQPTSMLKVTGRKNENGDPEGMFAEGELLWHSNESGTLTFTPGVSLLAADGVVGSATGFLTTTDWYESQSESFRSELDEMILVHKFTPGKINPGLREEQDTVMYKNMCPVDGVRVPLVIQSPGGIRGLHYSVNTIDRVDGMSAEESLKLFERINKELFTEDKIYDHWYQGNGDLCLFDNSITLHRRLGGITNRMCYRIQYDYTRLQDQPYVPYFQPEFAKQYKKQIREIVKTLEIDDFKLPKRTMADLLPW